MKKGILLTGCLILMLALCACNQAPEVSLVDPSVTSSTYVQNHSQPDIQESEESSQQSETTESEEVSEGSLISPQVSYDDEKYPDKAKTPQRINETLKKAGYKDLEFKETSPGQWKAENDNLDLHFETQLYIVQGFLYNVKVKEWNDKEIKASVDELCKFLNTVYPDAIDDVKKQEIIQVCTKASKSDDPGLYDITYQYKDEETTWFNFGINYDTKKIGVYNPSFPNYYVQDKNSTQTS